MSNKKHSLPSVFPRLLASTALLSTFLTSQAFGEAVDTEIVLLVDVSGSINESQLNVQKQAFAEAFRSSEVLNAIQRQCHTNKSIAATLVYWAASGQQYTAVEWMKIDSTTTANQFADAIEASPTTFSGGRTALGEAITHGTQLFGSETGNAGNGFESLYQVINLTANGVDNATPPRVRDRSVTVEAARDAALADGVEMINGIPIIVDSPNLDTYFEDHVIGGEVNGVTAQFDSAADFPDLAPAVKNQILHGISAADCPPDLVPEPSVSILFAAGAMSFLFRRKK